MSEKHGSRFGRSRADVVGAVRFGFTDALSYQKIVLLETMNVTAYRVSGVPATKNAALGHIVYQESWLWEKRC